MVMGAKISDQFFIKESTSKPTTYNAGIIMCSLSRLPIPEKGSVFMIFCLLYTRYAKGYAAKE
jgi:hypothetical protein